MLGLENDALSAAGKCIQFAIINTITTYVNHVKNYEVNMDSLLKDLETLRVEKDYIDKKVLLGNDKFKEASSKTVLWLVEVRKFTNDERMTKLMKKDMEIAKVMLRLMNVGDLKKLVGEDGEMRNLVAKMMKDIAKTKGKAVDWETVYAEEMDEKVGQVMEKLLEETMEEFKTLMQDMELAVAALDLLETHPENLKRLVEEDEVMADIISRAREKSIKEELVSDDNHDNVLVRENTLRQRVKDLVKPVGEVFFNEAVLKTLPENVKLVMDAMGVVIGNRRGLKAELVDSDDTTSSHRNCCCVLPYKYFSNRHDMSVEAEAMVTEIAKIIGRKPGSREVTVYRRKRDMGSIPIISAGLESRDELFKKIINALASNKVQALGVFGMGGSGKTRLAKEVDSSKANGIFEMTVMVEISESPNIEDIQDQILTGLGPMPHDVYGVHDKAKHIYDKLKNEQEQSSQGEKDSNPVKTLIILDNIWNKIDLVEIGIDLHYCKILVTSREKNVCKEMDVHGDNIYKVGLLSKGESKVLFKSQVPNDIQTEEHKSIVDRLLEKCGGLPLSIVATANSVKGKELPLWRQFADELEKPISCQISGLNNETFSILRTSYEAMASEEKKKFFVLACLSPVGSQISIDNLMRYGIGLGLFQHVNKLSEAIAQAHIWAEELVSSSMLLEGDSKEEVRIHDVVRESTMSFASTSHLKKDRQMFLVDAIPRWIYKESFDRYTGISLLNRANYARLNGVKAKLLQILLLRGSKDGSSFLQSDFFQGMTNLKVLELLSMNFEEGLPESMARLKELKTLHLVKCKLGDIKLIGELKSLLVLSLHGSSMEGLPDEIGKLCNLQLLDLGNCRCEQPRIPANVITKLSVLEGIYLFNSDFTERAVTGSTSNDTRVTNGTAMDELNKLGFLNVLEMSIFKAMSLPMCDQFVEKLDKFQIRLGDNNIWTLPSQRLLAISGFDVIGELKEDNCLKALLQKADLLALMNVTVKNNMVPELDEEGFRDLSHLDLHAIHNISRICEGEAPSGLFCNLRYLKVSYLKDSEELLPINPVPRKLDTLDIVDCNSLTYIFYKNKVNKESNIVELPCLKMLRVSYVSRLRSVVEHSYIDENQHQSFFSGKVKLPSLEALSLTSTGSIAKLWGKDSNIHSFQNLKELIIEECQNMETIGPPSIFLSLVQLESLSVKGCNAMQQVISEESEGQEISEKIITFPKLKGLLIESSEKLECFYGGSYKLDFLRLETLDLKCLENMAKFAGCSDSTTFFNEQVKFPSLKNLSFIDAMSIAKLWGKESNMDSFRNLKELIIEECQKMETIGPPSIFLSLVQLESLSVKRSSAMQQVISKEGESREIAEEIIIKFPKLKCLIIEYLEKLECFYGGSYKLEFPHLETLDLNCLQSMAKFAGCSDSSTFFNEQVESQSLKKLSFSNSSIVKLWDKESNMHSFQNLKELNVHGCYNMEAIGPPSIFLSLVQLESLSVMGCDVRQVISKESENQEIAEKIITFPKLKGLLIESSENLECFYGGSYKLDFPLLETLDLKYLQSMAKFAGCSDSTTFFNEQVTFPSLKKLIFIDAKSIAKLWDKESNMHSFPILKEVIIEGCVKMETIGPPSIFLSLVQLESLSVKRSDAMQQVISEEIESQEVAEEIITFPKLKCLVIEYLEKLECFYGGSYKLEFPRLETLDLKYLQSMAKFAGSSDSSTFFNDQVKLPCLEELDLYFNSSIVKLWSKKSSLHSFQNLKILKIDSCRKMETVGPPSTFLSLVQLESLEIVSCNKMQHVICAETEEQDIPEKVITFTKLKFLSLRYVESFYGGGYKMNFSCLETLELLKVRRMAKFAGWGNSMTFFHGKMRFPCLKELKCRELIDGVKLSSIFFPSLSRLVVEAVGDAKFLFSSPQNEGSLGAYSQFPDLEYLNVRSCPDSVQQFVEHDGSTDMLNFCEQLRGLMLRCGVNMKVISLHLFKRLRNLCVFELAIEYLFSADEGFETLQLLEELYIYNCPNLEVIIRGGDRNNAVVFPRLKVLKLEDLEHLSKFSFIPDIPIHFPSLDRLHIKSCRRLETICSGAFVAPELRKLKLARCDELKWLISGEPNQALELPSLEIMRIVDCDSLKSFSTRPLEAPLLSKIYLEDCFEMKQLFSGNTNYSAESADLVLTLPYLKDLKTYRCPNMKSFSPAVVRAPRLSEVTVNGECSYLNKNEDLNQFFSPSDDEDY